MVTSLGGGGGSTVLGWRLIVVPHKMRVRGYQILAEVWDTADKDWRLFIQHADDLTGCPWGARIKNSDTGVRVVSASTSTTLHIRDRPQSPLIRVQGTSNLPDLKYLNLVLPNVVDLEPGLYWIGIARVASLGGTPSFYGDYFPGNHRGLRDMMYGSSLSTALGSLDPAALVALDSTKRLYEQVFRVPGSTPSTVALCNISVALLADKVFNG